MINTSDIQNKKFNLCIIGLGRIGLPLALAFAIQGVKVFGIEKRKEILDLLNSRQLPYQEEGLQAALEKGMETGRLTFAMEKDFAFEQCSIIIVAVGTPLKENLLPDMSLVYNVMSTVTDKAAEGTIVILRSTLAPGTTQKLILPFLKKANKHLHIAVCPERIVEGNAMKELATLPEIVGVDDEDLGIPIKELFLILGKEKEIGITNTRTAEAAKIFTNMYRYVNFALANEFAIISEKLEIDAREAIGLANKGYSRSRIPMPGPAAGPCLRKDGLFLSKTESINLIKNAWLLNESIPMHVVETIEQKYGVLHSKKVGVLGKTYKANIDDMRDSPAARLIEELELKGATVLSHDPFVTNNDTLEEVLNSEIVILAVNHSAFDKITEHMLKKTKLVYDIWGQFSHLDLHQYGVDYITLGRGLKGESSWQRRKLMAVKY